MTDRKLITGNAAAAWGARLAGTDYIPAFPITPQTEIIETLSAWVESKEMPGRLVMMESEHSMITAAGAAAATGVRVFSATSSQGLLYGMEMLYTVAGWRVPFVLVNVSRGLSAPITLESDHNDIMAARDSGALQIHCASCQEVVDSILMAYRIAEHPSVRLPVIVNLDGFYLSYTREPVTLPDADAAAAFVGPFDSGGISMRASHPISQAVAVLGGGAYSYFRYEMHLAARAAVAVYEEVADDFAARFGRHHPAVESYRMEDAEFAFVMMGSFSSKARTAVDALRDGGMRIGLVRPRLIRPFADDALRAALGGLRGVAVIDQNISNGFGGVLHGELVSVLYGDAAAPPVVASFIGGLGGRDITQEEFAWMAADVKKAADSGERLKPRLLYSEEELREVRKLQAVAAVERDEIGAEK